MNKTFNQKLAELLKKYFDHDVVYVSHERRAEAHQAIKEAIREIVPKEIIFKDDEVPLYEEVDKRDGWNEYRQALLRKLEE